jgi:uroporphyrinogen decarboxylase
MARFRQDRLTEKERFEALLHRQPVDRVPFYMWEFSFAAATVGYSRATTFTDPVKSFEAFRRTHEMYDGWHYIYYSPGAIGVREFGGEAKLPTGEYAQAVSPIRPVVQSEEDALSLKVPDVKTAGMIPLVMEFAKLQESHGFPITFSFGKYSESRSALTGAETMCRWMIKKPQVVHRLCRLVADFHIAVAQHVIRSFDCPERIIPLTAAPTESNQMISPKHFREFSLPYQKEVYERILAMGVKHINTHICGEQT